MKGSPCDTLTTALKEPKAVNIGVNAFPNPTDGLLKLSFYNTHTSSDVPHSIQVFNTIGAVLKHIEIERLQDTDIDIRDLASGIYILKVTSKDGQWSRTLKISVFR